MSPKRKHKFLVTLRPDDKIIVRNRRTLKRVAEFGPDACAAMPELQETLRACRVLLCRLDHAGQRDQIRSIVQRIDAVLTEANKHWDPYE